MILAGQRNGFDQVDAAQVATRQRGGHLRGGAAASPVNSARSADLGHGPGGRTRGFPRWCRTDVGCLPALPHRTVAIPLPMPSLDQNTSPQAAFPEELPPGLP
jgi:hypothetical protein